MVIVLSFLVGTALGASILYWVSQKTIGAQRKQLEQNHRLMGELEQSHETRMRDTLESLNRKHQKELESQRQPLDKQIEELNQKHQEGLNDLAQDHWNTLEAFQTERYLEISNLKQEHQNEVTNLNAEIIGLKQKFKSDMMAIQKTFQKKLEDEVESARSQFQVVVDKFINDHEVEITQLKQKHRQEIEALSAPMNGAAAGAAMDAAMNNTPLAPLASSHVTVQDPADNSTSLDQAHPTDNLATDEVQKGLTNAVPQVSFDAPPSSMPNMEEKLPVSTEIMPEPDPFIATIEMLGRSKRVSAIDQLSKQVAQAAPEGRQAIAQALGQIVSANPQSPALQRTIPPLTKLSQDSKPTVRQAAIEALGNIPSTKVVPIVKRALRDPDTKVIKAANQAMEKLKPFAKSGQA